MKHLSISGWKCNLCFLTGTFPIQLRVGFRANSTRTFASKDSVKKLRRGGRVQKIVSPPPSKVPSDEFGADKSPPVDDSVQDESEMSSFDSSGLKAEITIPSRSSVLQACTVTSALMAALGIIIRQVSGFASAEGWPVSDCSAEISFSFEMWHLQLITGLVILISSSRLLLLKAWPEFAESSEAANQQVLTSLEPLDYIVVAFLPGLSEELLFRGALLPFFGVNWISALGVAGLFGYLHVGSGRKYSFGIWATFVGLAYGYATILSSSVIIPMASHAVNNLIGGIIWRYSSNRPR